MSWTFDVGAFMKKYFY